MKYSVIIFLLLIFGFNDAPAQDKIKWYPIEKAVKMSKKNPKMIFVDMYTDWCGWCKRMDQTTFIDPVIVAYMNEYYYPVKFNAERKDTVLFNQREYVNSNPEGRRSSHQLAQKLLNGRMSYPSFVFLNEKAEVITVLPGYQQADKFEPILHFISDEAYKDQSFEQYLETFQSAY